MKRLLLGFGFVLIGAAIALPPVAAQSAAGGRSSDAQRPTTQLETVKPATPAAPVGFSELWTLAKPASGTTGWLLESLRRAE